MRPLRKHIEDSIERKYHLSYDVIDSRFESNDAKLFILENLKKFGATSVSSPCESTIIFTYPNKNFDIKSFYNLIKDDFYFSICLVSRDFDNKEVEKVNKSRKIDNVKLQEDWDSIIVRP